MAEEVINQNTGEDWKGFKPSYEALDSYDSLIAESKNKNISYGDGDLSLTIEIIKRAVYENIEAVRPLANHLKGGTIQQTAFNVWHWIRTNINYVYDTYGIEEIRSPQRMYQEKRGDCDCFTVFSACVFRALNLDCEAHIVTFSGKTEPSHIYCVVGGVVVDAVLSKFNEVPRGVLTSKTQKIKFSQNMNGLGEIDAQIFGIGEINEAAKMAVLRPFMAGVDGLGAVQYSSPVMAGFCQLGYDMMHCLDGLGLIPEVREEAYRQVQRGLFHAGVWHEPDNVKYLQGFESLGGLDGLGSWFSSAVSAVTNTVKKAADVTKQAVTTVVKKTADVAKGAASTVMNVTSQINKTATGLVQKAADAVGAGKLLQPITNITNKITDAASNAVKTVTNVVTASWEWSTQKINDLAFKIGDAVQRGLKWIGSKALTLFLAPARIAFLGLIKVNFCGMASKLSAGCHDEETAKSLGYDMAVWKIAKDRTDRVCAFWGTIGGDASQLVAAILTSKDLLSFGIKGIDGLSISQVTPSNVGQFVMEAAEAAYNSGAPFSAINSAAGSAASNAMSQIARITGGNSGAMSAASSLVSRTMTDVSNKYKNLPPKTKAVSPAVSVAPVVTKPTYDASTVQAAAPILEKIQLIIQEIKMPTTKEELNAAKAISATAFFTLLRVNYLGMASKLYPAILTAGQAANNYPTLDAAALKQIRDVYALISAYVSAPDALNAAINEGYKKPILLKVGVNGLGYEPVSTASAASVAASAPILTKVLSWLKGVKMADLLKYVKEGSEMFKKIFPSGGSPQQVDAAQNNADAVLTAENTKLTDKGLEDEFSKLTANYEGAAAGGSASGGGSSDGSSANYSGSSYTGQGVAKSVSDPTPNVANGSSNSKMWLIGGGVAALAAVMLLKKDGKGKKRRK